MAEPIPPIQCEEDLIAQEIDDLIEQIIALINQLMDLLAELIGQNWAGLCFCEEISRTTAESMKFLQIWTPHLTLLGVKN